MDYHYFIIQLLYLVEYADYNSQAKLGMGYTSNLGSGETDVLGMHSGSLGETDKTSVIYRGIADIFGEYQLIDGINIKDFQAYICYNQSEYESDKFDGCYEKVGYVNASTTDWISKLGYDSNHPLVAFPIDANGSDTTYITDRYYKDYGNRIAKVGGYPQDGLGRGLWNWSLSEESSRGEKARLLRLG